MDTNLFDPLTLTLTPKVICKNGAKIETYTWRPGKSIKFEFFLTPAWRPWIPTYLTHDLWPWPQRSYVKTAPKNQKNLKINKVRIFSHPCLALMDTNLFDPWTLTLTPKVICKNGAKIETYTWRPGKYIKFEFFLTPAWRPWIPTYLTHDLWPWPQRSYVKTAPKNQKNLKINKVRIFSHPCLAPMDTNYFHPWPLTLTPKVICKNGAKNETYTWRPGKSIKFEFFLTPAWRPWIPTYLTHELWPWPQRSYVKTAPKSKLTPGDQENQ